VISLNLAEDFQHPGSLRFAGAAGHNQSTAALPQRILAASTNTRMSRIREIQPAA